MAKNEKSKDELDQIVANSKAGLDEREVVSKSEIAQVIREINKDELNEDNMTSMDIMSNLSELECNGILQTDFLTRMSVIPTKCNAFTRQKKRLSCSVGGLARKQAHDLARGVQDQEIQKQNSGFSFGRLFGGKNNGDSKP